MPVRMLFGIPSRRKRRTQTLPGCEKCKRNIDCVSPKMPFVGKGKKDILFLLDTPGRTEDKSEHKKTGDTLQYLKSLVADKFGIDLFQDCWVGYAVCCAGGKHPTEENALLCQPLVHQKIKELSPKLIFALGECATASSSALASE